MRENSIKLLIDEANRCLDTGYDLAALIVVLTIPDVCGKVLYPNESSSQRYKNWFNFYIGDYEQSPLEKGKPESEQMPYMNGEVFYKLRCAMLHEGTDDIASKISIDEFNLMFAKSARLESTSIEQRTNYMSDGTIRVEPKVVTWNINVFQICKKVIMSAEAFLENEAMGLANIPTIQIQPEIPPIFKVK